jgi:hypothetical protein
MLTVKQAEDGAEDLNDEDAHEHARVRRVGDGGGRAGDADGDPAQEVTHPDGQPAPEERVACARVSSCGRGRDGKADR